MANKEVPQEGATTPQFDRNALAREYAGYYGVTQREGENDDAFRSRVSGELRRQGSIIEAHEAYSGKRWDAEDQGATGPMAGIFGAVAQAMQGRDYSPNDPERQIGDDIAAGVVARAGEDPTRAALRAIFDALGPGAGMDLIEGVRGGDKPKK